MQRDENISALGVCQSRTVVERWVVISLAREDDAQSLGLKRNAQQPRVAEDNVAFRDAGRSARPRIRAAMRRIKNDNG